MIQSLMRLWPARVAVVAVSALSIQIPLIQLLPERQTAVEVLQILFVLQTWSRNTIVF